MNNMTGKVRKRREREKKRKKGAMYMDMVYKLEGHIKIEWETQSTWEI